MRCVLTTKVCTGKPVGSHGIAYTSADESSQPLAPELQSLTLSDLYIPSRLKGKLSNFLSWRREHNMGLEILDVRSCHVDNAAHEMNLKESVKEATWENVTDSPYYESESEHEDTEEEAIQRRMYHKYYSQYATVA